MPTFEWKEFFSVGHECLDNQHKELFAAANALHDGMMRPDGIAEAELRVAIETLCDFTRSHFAAEERLMQSAGYPDFEKHKEAHDELSAKMEAFEARVRNGEMRVAAEILPFLVSEWLSRHIAFEDQQYAGYINSYSRSPRAKALALEDQYARCLAQPERRHRERVGSL